MQVNISKKAYNHCRYAGNNGDVWKHFLLLEVLRQLAFQKKHMSFHYVETHAGPGYARLGENGDWKRGIGRFMGTTNAAPSHPYFDIVLPGMEDNCLYKGSWVLSCELLRNLKHPNFKLTVHEVSAETLKMAGSAIKKGQLSPWVRLEPKSGYDALQKMADANFVLIDPPYRSSDGTADDWSKVFKAVERAKAIGSHWIVWYPVFRRTEPDELIEFSGGTTFELEWAPEAPGWVMKGCGMLMDQESADLLRYQPGMLNSIAESLGGNMKIISSASKTKSTHQIPSPHEPMPNLSRDAYFSSNPI
jgi:23S rRNA A2030 N6-methylase RlmJ